MTETSDDVPKRRRKLLTALAVCGFLLLIPASGAMAQVDFGLTYIEPPDLSYATSVEPPDLSRVSVEGIVISLIRVALGLAALVMLVKLLGAGISYMTYDGSEDTREEAIQEIKGLVTGLIIVIISASATKFLITAAANAAQSQL